MVVSTENKTALEGSQTNTIGQTNRGIQQAHKLAAANTQGVSVGNQVTPQADPNKFSQDLNSIFKALGNTAQDTYALNDALVDDMISDDTAMMVAGLDELDKSLKPNESRSQIIKVAESFRADLITKKQGFDGNADMEARYKRKFVDPSASDTMKYIKKWQNEDNEIVKNKEFESEKENILNVYPYMGYDPVTGEVSEDGKSRQIESYNKSMTNLNKWDVVKAGKLRLSIAKSMTNNLKSEIYANPQNYMNRGSKSIYNPYSGKFDREATTKLFNSKYYMYGEMDKKGVIKFRSKDTAVNKEISESWATLMEDFNKNLGKSNKESNMKILKAVYSQSRYVGKEQKAKILIHGEDTGMKLYSQDDALKLTKAKAAEMGIAFPADDFGAYQVTFETGNQGKSMEQYAKAANTPIGYSVSFTGTDIENKSLSQNRAAELTQYIDTFNSLGAYSEEEDPRVTDARERYYKQIQAEFRTPNGQSNVIAIKSLTKNQVSNPTSNQAYQEWQMNKSIFKLRSVKGLMHRVEGGAVAQDTAMLMRSQYQRWEDKYGSDENAPQFTMTEEEYSDVVRTANGNINQHKSSLVVMNANSIREYNTEYNWLPINDRTQLKNTSTLYVTSSRGGDFDDFDNITSSKYKEMKSSSSGKIIHVQETDLVKNRTFQPSDKNYARNFEKYIDSQIDLAIEEDRTLTFIGTKAKLFGYTLVESPFNTGEFVLHVIDKSQNNEAIHSGIVINIGNYKGKVK